MMANRNPKTLEEKLKEHMYKNVQVLMLIYPTTEELRAIVSIDMFSKNSKAAFLHVTHFLLETLDPELTKQKIKSWPVYDARTEAQFRNEVVKYVNELNTHPHYGDLKVELPHITVSHLIMHRGYKLFLFLFKLSQLVLVNVAIMDARLNKYALLPITPNINVTLTKKYISDKQALTNKIYKRIEKHEEGLNDYINKCKEEAEAILKEQADTEKLIAEIEDKIKTERNQLEANHSESNELDVNKRVDSLQPTFRSIEEINDKMEAIKMILEKLNNGKKSILEYDKKDLIIPSDIDHILDANDEELDLLKFFDGLRMFIEKNLLDIPAFSNDDVTSMLKSALNSNNKLQMLNERLKKIHGKFTVSSWNNETVFKG